MIVEVAVVKGVEEGGGVEVHAVIQLVKVQFKKNKKFRPRSSERTCQSFVGLFISNSDTAPAGVDMEAWRPCPCTGALCPAAR